MRWSKNKLVESGCGKLPLRKANQVLISFHNGGRYTYIVGMYALGYVCVDHTRTMRMLYLYLLMYYPTFSRSRVDCNPQWCTCSKPWLGKGKGYEGEILMLAYEHKSLYILVTHRWRKGWGFPTLCIQSFAKGTTDLNFSIADISHHRHHWWWWTFFKLVYFLSKRAQKYGLFWPALVILAILSRSHAISAYFL